MGENTLQNKPFFGYDTSKIWFVPCFAALGDLQKGNEKGTDDLPPYVRAMFDDTLSINHGNVGPAFGRLPLPMPNVLERVDGNVPLANGIFEPQFEGEGVQIIA